MAFPNLSQVEVVGICQPDHFRVILFRPDKEYMRKFCRLRREMQIYFKDKSSLENREDYENTEYRKGDIVAVKIEKVEMWERGKIENVSEEGYPTQIDVFLIDQGNYVKVLNTSNIRHILNPNWLHVEARVKEFILIGLSAISKDMDYLTSRMKTVFSSKWSELSHNFMQDMLKLSQSVFIDAEPSAEMDDKNLLRKSYGYMFLNFNIQEYMKLDDVLKRYSEKKILLSKYFKRTNPERVSVHELLIRGRFCKRQESYQKTEEVNEKKLVSSTPIAFNERLIRWPLGETKSEKAEDFTSSNENWGPGDRLSTSPGTSIAERLMRWPLEEEIFSKDLNSEGVEDFTSSLNENPFSQEMQRPKKKESLVTKHPRTDKVFVQKSLSNFSSLYYTAEDNGSNSDKSSILAGNIHFLGTTEGSGNNFVKPSSLAGIQPPLDIVSEPKKSNYGFNVKEREENVAACRPPSPLAASIFEEESSKTEKRAVEIMSEQLTSGAESECTRMLPINSKQKTRVRQNCQCNKFILCHGDKGCRKIKPILSIDGFPKSFNKILKQILHRRKVYTATKIQEYLWPIVSSTYSVVVIGPKDSGKSYGYLIPMVDILIRTMDESRLKLKNISSASPLAIILCPSWKVVLQTEEVLKILERELKNATGQSASQPPRTLAIHEAEDKLKHSVALINGCQILITTPPSLIRIMKLHTNENSCQGTTINMKLHMCSHIVFENADECFEKFDDEIAQIMSEYKSSRIKEKVNRGQTKEDSSIEMFDQIIVTSRTWCDSIDKFVKTFVAGPEKVGPYFVFCDYLEAAVYGRLKMASYLLKDEQSKLETVKNIVRSYDLKACRKILIHTNNETVVNDLIEYLSNIADDLPKIVPMFLPLEETSKLQTREILNVWRETSQCDNLNEYYPLIVADTQDVEPLGLFETDECSEDVVIMFDLPESSKKSFSQRFSHMSNGFNSFYENNELERCSSTKPACHMLVTPLDREKFKTVYMFLKRISMRHKEATISMPQNLTSLYLQFQEEDGTKKHKEDLCLNIKLFGRCKNKRVCAFRHYINQNADFYSSLMNTQSVLANGVPSIEANVAHTVEYDVAFVNSASHYYVRLRRTKNKSGQVLTDYSKSCVRLGLKLGCLEEKGLEELCKKDLVHLERNELFLVTEKDEFKRAKLLLKVNKDDLEKILLVDEGRIVRLNICTKIWKLPSNLKDMKRYPIHAAEVILLGVRPRDKEIHWPKEPCQLIRKGLLIKPQKNCARNHESTEENNESISKDDMQYEEGRDTICRSKCSLVLGNTIWAEQVQLLEKLSCHDINADGVITRKYAASWTPIFEAKETLIRKQMGDENSEHASLLMEMCKTANLPIQVQERLKLDLMATEKSALPQMKNISQNIGINQFCGPTDVLADEPIVSNQTNLRNVCSPEVRKMYQVAKYDIIHNHQWAHLETSPTLDELSDSGLPDNETLEEQSKIAKMSPSELLMQSKLLKLTHKLKSRSENRVLITYVYSPFCLYVRHAKFSKQLSSLEKDMTIFAEQAKILYSPGDLEISDGRICIGRQLKAPSEEGSEILWAEDQFHTGKDIFEYKRVQIIRRATKEDEEYEKDPMENFRCVHSDDENDNDQYSNEDLSAQTSCYTVFFVDYGFQRVLNAFDLLPIPKVFVEKLPFQAIQCCLSNIKPLEDDNENMADATDLMMKKATITENWVEGERRLGTSTSQPQFIAQDVYKFDKDPDILSDVGHVSMGYYVKLATVGVGDHLGMELVQAGVANFNDNEHMLNLEMFDSTKEVTNTDADINAEEQFDTKPSKQVNISPVDKILANHRDNFSKKDLPQNICVKALNYRVVPLPKMIPGVCIDMNSENCSSFNLMPSSVIWSQNKAKTNVTFKIQLDLLIEQELCSTNLYLSVTKEFVELEYLEIGHISNGEEEFRHHKLPKLNLYGTVCPQKIDVKFCGRQVVIVLIKVNPCFWKQATIDPATGKPVKLPWMRIDGMDCDSSDSNSDYKIEHGHQNSDYLKRRHKARATKIREMLNQFPKPNNMYNEARNFDDSTDDIEKYQDQSNVTSDSDVDSDNIDMEGVGCAGKNDTTSGSASLRGLYMNRFAEVVTYDPDTSNYLK